jgi:hypothetical protein
MGMYWTKVDEDNCEAFRLATTPKEELKYYNKIITKLNITGRNLQQKYFYNCDSSMVSDAINHTVLKIKSHYNPKVQSSYYSFSSVLIKNYLIDNTRQTKFDITSIDDLPWIEEEFPDDSQSITDRDEEVQQRILKRFNELLSRDRQIHQRKQYSLTTTGRTRMVRSMKLLAKHIKFMEACIEYIQRFPNGSMNGMIQYCQLITGFNDNQCRVCAVHYFNYSHMPKLAESKLATNVANGHRKKNKYDDNPMGAWLNDNWTPCEDNAASKIRSRIALCKSETNSL